MKLHYLLLATLFAAPAHAANLAPQPLALAGTTPTYNAANSGGDAFVNDGKTYVHVKNASGGSITVTFDAVPGFNSNAYGDVAFADTAVTVAAGAEKVIGVFPPSRFNDVNGRVNMAYSAASSVTVAVVKVGRTYP